MTWENDYKRGRFLFFRVRAKGRSLWIATNTKLHSPRRFPTTSHSLSSPNLFQFHSLNSNPLGFSLFFTSVSFPFRFRFCFFNAVNSIEFFMHRLIIIIDRIFRFNSLIMQKSWSKFWKERFRVDVMPPGRRKGAKKSTATAGSSRSRSRSRRQWNIGDLVLAKVKGFPAWPATVCVFFVIFT